MQVEKKLYLNFQVAQDLLINIVCVSGEGFFYWEEENRKYYLSGYVDRIILTSRTIDVNHKLSHLIASANQKQFDKEGNPDFVFYITYYPRTTDYNMDQVIVGQTY